jgi:transcriptional regulator with XRE-family HTH domain
MMQIDKEKFGKFIKYARKANGYGSMTKLAEALNVDQSTIGKIETGERLPSFELFIDLALKLKMTPGQLMDELAGLPQKSSIIQMPVYLVGVDKVSFSDDEAMMLPPDLAEEDLRVIFDLAKLLSGHRRREKELVIKAELEKLAEDTANLEDEHEISKKETVINSSR